MSWEPFYGLPLSRTGFFSSVKCRIAAFRLLPYLQGLGPEVWAVVVTAAEP